MYFFLVRRSFLRLLFKQTLFWMNERTRKWNRISCGEQHTSVIDKQKLIGVLMNIEMVQCDAACLLFTIIHAFTNTNALVMSIIASVRSVRISQRIHSHTHIRTGIDDNVRACSLNAAAVTASIRSVRTYTRSNCTNAVYMCRMSLAETTVCSNFSQNSTTSTLTI